MSASAVSAPSAAVVRASIERGDPGALRDLLAVIEAFPARAAVARARAATEAARAHSAVGHDPARIAADPTASDTDTHREDSAAMEHERQRRLRSWQVER